MNPGSPAAIAATPVSAAPYSYEAALRLVDELGVTEPVAIVLVRRGHATPGAAREFLAADESHDSAELTGVDEAVRLVRAAAAAGSRITVHGDYDVDGTAATAILVAALRRCGADPGWVIPSRLDDGYGLSPEGIERIAASGTELLITADCGITAVAEVAQARRLGIEVIVTDHHQPSEDGVPECCVLHPLLSGYPFTELCGAAVAHKLAGAIGRATGTGPLEPDLDLVALATVADLVPLEGENRSLVRRGLEELRRARRPGLRALMRASKLEPERVDEGDLAFRLGPRLNAAGRMHRADGCVELMLTEDEVRAGEIAAELDAANRERRQTERGVLAAAEAELRALPAELREAPAIVLAGEEWHPGVVGIVASRMAERHGKPTVLIGLDAGGRGRGSGRSVPGFDLLAGIEACAGTLVRFGGHRAAAGLEIDGGQVDAFREAFIEHASTELDSADRFPDESIDAVVGGEALDYETAEQLEALGPFGKGNPPVRLLVPWARVGEVRPMGEGGRHARFTLSAGAGRAAGVAFGVDGSLEQAAKLPHDLTVSLELNQWNGTTAPRIVLGSTWERPGGAASAAGCPDPAPDAEWWERLVEAYRAPLESGPVAAEPAGPGRRVEVDRRGGSIVARMVELLSSGEPVLALCADAQRRRELLELAVDPTRFGSAGALACRRCGRERARERLDEVRRAGAGIALADWLLLDHLPAVGEGFAHVIAVDPPAFPAQLALAAAGEGYLHLAWGAAELALAQRVHDADFALRPSLAAAYTALRAAGEDGLAGAALRGALEGPGLRGSGPEAAGRCLRMLGELGLLDGSPDMDAGGLRALSSVNAQLESSAAYVAYGAWHEEGREFLSRQSKNT